MRRSDLTLLATGDLVLPQTEADWLFDETPDVLQSADVVVGHVESFNSLRGHHATAEPGTGYWPRVPRILEAIPRAGFHVATMAHKSHLRRGSSRNRGYARRAARSGHAHDRCRDES